MNLNFFKNKEQKTNSPVEEIKNTTEVEASQEEEISPERIEALKEFDKEAIEIASLKESDLKENIENPEEREALGDKLSTLAKIAETLKNHAPEIAIAATGLAAIAFGFSHSTADMADSAVMSTEKISVMIASSIGAVSAVFSTLLWNYKNFSKEENTQSHKMNNSNEAIAA
jgi:hypothetical protein